MLRLAATKVVRIFVLSGLLLFGSGVIQALAQCNPDTCPGICHCSCDSDCNCVCVCGCE